MDYKFKAEKFAIDDKGFHLLRNEFNYQSFDFTAIDNVKLVRGFDLKNWIVVATVGILLIGFAIYDIIQIVGIVLNPEGVLYIERLIIPILPFLLGIYSLSISFRKATVLKIELNSKKHYFSLRKLEKTGEVENLISYLNDLNLNVNNEC
ncbi:MAG: hypothetical protein MI922_04220 [Bacteroidales bacterium]|nr:hypothetical protein [Bacteroidales bacterium]